MPDRRNLSIQWQQNQTQVELRLDNVDKNYKKRTINFLVMDSGLNERLNRFDIVTRIEMIRNWYDGREQQVPKHINWFIQKIESMRSYRALCDCKRNDYDEHIVAEKYKEFLNDYFEEEHELEMISGLIDLLKTSFEN